MFARRNNCDCAWFRSRMKCASSPRSLWRCRTMAAGGCPRAARQIHTIARTLLLHETLGCPTDGADRLSEGRASATLTTVTAKETRYGGIICQRQPLIRALRRKVGTASANSAHGLVFPRGTTMTVAAEPSSGLERLTDHLFLEPTVKQMRVIRTSDVSAVLIAALVARPTPGMRGLSVNRPRELSVGNAAGRPLPYDSIS